MREIKFRGKRIDNGEWVYGYIVKVASPCGLGWVMHIPAKDPDDNHRVVQVNPSTVGQYTGLKDKNGVEIYEGDIARCTNEAGEISKLNSDTGIGVIEWIGRWGFWNISKIENGLGDILNCGYVEVIGNIHNNPELIGGAE